MNYNIMQIKEHPEYWDRHKKIWQEEYDNLDVDTCKLIVDNPKGTEAKELNTKVNLIVIDELKGLTRKHRWG
tara:strand:+ start:1615 stop:1830 length:216 start_codon:yes stop_codon:yes gene_type:complete